MSETKVQRSSHSSVSAKVFRTPEGQLVPGQECEEPETLTVSLLRCTPGMALTSALKEEWTDGYWILSVCAMKEPGEPLYAVRLDHNPFGEQA